MELLWLLFGLYVLCGVCSSAHTAEVAAAAVRQTLEELRDEYEVSGYIDDETCLSDLDSDWD